MTAVLETRGVTKRFGGVGALDGVDFALAPGEVHALAGENGAGKSTLIKILTGYHRPTSGEVLLDGRPVAFAGPHESRRRGIACVYQEIDLVPTRSVAQNVFLGAEPRTRFGLLDAARMRRETTAILRRYGIDVDVDTPLAGLSLGLQQMVAIARAVSADAKVLILDEPTSALDAAEAEVLAGVVRRLAADGVAVVYVSHRLDEVYDLCDRITVLRDGRVVRTAATGELPRGELVAAMLGRELAAEHEAERRPPARSARPALRVTGLCWGNRVRDVDLEVAPGEIVGLAGLLGAGRTETARALFGAVRPTAGTVEVDGTPVRPGSPAASIAAGLAFLPEDRAAEGVIPELSVRENILAAVLPRLSRGGWTRRAAQRDVVARHVDAMGIKAAGPEQPVGRLSGGNQQKVLLARWLATKPKMLILDEPTRGIDVGAKAEIQAMIRRLADDGLGVLIISSEVEEILHGTDRVVVLRDGRVAGELRGDEITEPNLLALYSGEVVA